MSRPVPKKVRMFLTKDDEEEEYVVKYYEDGKYQEGPTIYEYPLGSTLDTMRAETRRLENLGVQVELGVSSKVRRSADYRLVSHELKDRLEGGR